MNKKLHILLLIVTIVNSIYGRGIDDIKIKLFSSYTADKAMISVEKGSYYLIALDSKGNEVGTIARISASDKFSKSIYFYLSNSMVSLYEKKMFLGRYHKLYIKAGNKNSSFRIIYGKQKERIYDGSLFLKHNKGNLEIINFVNIESYVAGVVESEVGSKGNMEFYKALSILARTYAVKNLDKFIDYGYNLTDDVRSQVYFSKSYFVKGDLIAMAVEQTKNKVIVDQNDRIIFPAFHANSGGETANSDDVWVTKLPYLHSIKDPYSLSIKDSTFWEIELNRNTYLNYFYKKAPKYRYNDRYTSAILNFKQKKRKSNFSYKEINIPLKDIRKQFKFRSTFFDVLYRGDKVIIKGRGYGHGVGLSQVGAMIMGEKGFSYSQIIKFYYRDVKIIDYHNILIE